MAKCAGCGQETTLLDSHVIPEFFYKYVYTKDHKFVEITPDNKDNLETKQKGLREKLLCSNCEQVLSKLEKTTSEFIREITSGNYKTISAQQISADVTILNNHKYEEIKRCMLSVLWRASVSKLDAFKEYDLGAHKERLRKISFGSSAIPWYEYPIIIERVRLGNFESSEMMVLHKKGKYKHKTLYSITLAGLNFDFYIDDNFIDKEHEAIFMKPVDMPITSIQLDELKVGQQFLKRFMDEDVKNFYNKHK